MDYQILALDLDGTLTNSKKEISLPTLEALIDIQKQGKKVVLASGRPTQGVLPLADQLLQWRTYNRLPPWTGDLQQSTSRQCGRSFV